MLTRPAPRDANTNELLIASAGTVTGSNLPPDRKPAADDVRSAIDEWARHVREQFDRIWQDERPEAGQPQARREQSRRDPGRNRRIFLSNNTM